MIKPAITKFLSIFPVACMLAAGCKLEASVMRSEAEAGDPIGPGNLSSVPSIPEKFSVGMEVGPPELVALSLRRRLSTKLAIRFGLSPPIPWKLRVPVTGRDFKEASGFRLAYPDSDIGFKILWGPTASMDMALFPMAGTFFIQAGLITRRILVSGHAQSPLIICAATEPSCLSTSERIITRSELAVDVDATFTGILGRMAVGWSWVLENGLILDAPVVGIAAPLWTSHRINVSADVVSPSGDSGTLGEAYRIVKEAKEEELESILNDSVVQYERHLLPVITISIGMHLR